VVESDGEDVRRYFQSEGAAATNDFCVAETLLFHGTIWYNIAYGKPEATRNGNSAGGLRMATCAGVSSINAAGLRPLVGSAASRFSGGQRQRIAIALPSYSIQPP